MVAKNYLEPAQEAGRAMILNEQKSMTMSDKQALKRQYMETKTRAGVYAIRNQITGRAMVAGSTNVQGTLNRHRFELRFGQHRNVRLAQDWAKYGETSFIFEVLDIVKPSEDPAFEATRELEELVNLWRQEIPCMGERGYDDPRNKA
ncbi:MAG: GIY-YIG nuclease family protein [Sideroxydans sp.]|nr:GIY-YIG nuclease family protein [Sideroxydans sp.]